MSNVAQLRAVMPPEVSVDLPTIVPDQEWELSFLGYSTALMFGRSEKLVLRFKILEPGEHFEEEVCKYYNVKLIGKPGRNGRFAPAKHSDFIRDYIRLFGRPGRNDRISMSNFAGKVVLGRTRTVTKDKRQKELGDAHYSVLDSINGFKE